jgi:hypothetical protein
MLINQFMPEAYYKTADHNLRVVNIRSLIRNNAEEIKRQMISPTREDSNPAESKSEKHSHPRRTAAR